MNDNLFEIKIMGNDFTPILNCLEDCCISYSGKNKKEHSELFDLLGKHFYFTNGRTNKEWHDIHFSNQDNVKKKIEKQIEESKKEEIGNIIKEKERNIKERIKETNKTIKNIEKELRKSQNWERFEELEKTRTHLEELKDKINRIAKIKEDNNDRFDLNKKNGLVVVPTKEDLYEIIGNEEKVDNLITLFDGYAKKEEWNKAVDSNLKNHPLIKMFKTFAEDIDLVEHEELIVGRRKEREFDLKEKDCKLYDYYKNKPRFGNLAGTIKKEYACDVFAGLYADCLDTSEYKLSEKLKQLSDSKISITVQIRSRFDDVPKMPFFLLELLTQGNVIFNNYSILDNDEDDALFDCLLLWRLKQYLLKAYQKGVYRTYQTFHDNGIKLKGTIDFAQHIKNNMGLNNGTIAYTYREKTVDNYLNHLILESYEHLKHKYYDIVVQNFDNVREVKEVISLLQRETSFPKYSRGIVIRKNETPIMHPYYTEYEDLRRVCLCILRDEGASIMSGSGDEVSGILYYIPDLWEEFLESRMLDTGVSAQDVIEALYTGNDYQNKFRPDFVFRNEDDNPFMILDAKYKPSWIYKHTTGKLGDYKSDYEECIRNMNAINAYSTGVIFPYSINEENEEDEENTNSGIQNKKQKHIEIEDNIIMHKISEYNDITSFYTIPICIPQPNKRKKKNNFLVWQSSFHSALDEKIGALKGIIDAENQKYKLIDAAIKKVNLNNYREEQKKHCKVYRNDT